MKVFYYTLPFTFSLLISLVILILSTITMTPLFIGSCCLSSELGVSTPGLSCFNYRVAFSVTLQFQPLDCTQCLFCRLAPAADLRVSVDTATYCYPDRELWRWPSCPSASPLIFCYPIFTFLISHLSPAFHLPCIPPPCWLTVSVPLPACHSHWCQGTFLKHFIDFTLVTLLLRYFQ